MNLKKSKISPAVVMALMLPVLLALVFSGCDYILPNKPPYVEKIKPADSLSFSIGQVVNFQVNAYDVDGSVVQVSFKAPNAEEFIDESAPYEYAWPTAGLTNGQYDVVIKALDDKKEHYIIKAQVRLLGILSSFAGKDTTYTDTRTSSVLEADMPPYSQGTWTILSGTGGQISDIHNPNATLTGLPCQAYTLRWTVNNGANQVSDEVTIRFFYQPSTAEAGSDQLVTDGRTTVTLQAAVPREGTGLWRVASGGTGTFSDAQSPAASFTGQPCNAYKLVWTVSTACAASADTVEVRFDPFLVQPNAGPDQLYTDGTHTTAVLAANAPTAGTGTWTVVSGQGGSFANATDPKTVFTGQLCMSYILRWTIATSCSAKTDDVSIAFGHKPSPANAGSDIIQTGTALSVNLAANAPTAGTGTWTVISGTGGSFADLHNPQTRFTGLACQAYALQWTVSTLCENSSDQLSVSFTDLPTSSNAGPDVKLTDGAINVKLNADQPVNGKGIWTVITGTGGSFSDFNDPDAMFYGVICHAYVLRWTVSTACSSSFDEVAVEFNQIEEAAYAGPDTRVSDGSLSVNMQANPPRQGVSGTWSVLAGNGGAFDNVNSPTARFTGNAGQLYTLKWTLSGSCIENSDQVMVAFIPVTILNDPRDGKNYRSIRIGNQQWMAENLNYSVAGSYAYNDMADNASLYGRLYIFSLAGSVCPAGWHLPTDAEWRQLEVFLGMDPATAQEVWYRGHEEGAMMKETGTLYWDDPNTGASNLSGMSARAGGYRTPGNPDGEGGVFGGIRMQAGFWTATPDAAGKAVYRALHKDKAQAGRDYYDKGYSFSVRCVKN